MTYRDETETLRAELDRARAELATIKSKPREVETIQWRDVYGGIANWVIATVLALIATSIGTCAASHDVYNEGPRVLLRCSRSSALLRLSSQCGCGSKRSRARR